ncbi:ABC transporter substrate-binding protein [Roseivirga sp. E12]|uniref:ABC transporter substrate-binding protein n=1 Tax=Roseivirga sp. E12 TaxID=2819237 RepID=UPI001ABD08FD|nr:ABC transporter substrate-binding protein [Roseivirga sp. E12]MBO3699044.1 ABC transporter substrate-binding protein [Roseivirga sp. E12]
MKYKIGLILPDSNYFKRFGKDYKTVVEAGLQKSGFDNYEIVIEPGGYNNQMKIMAEKVQSLIVKEQVDAIIAPFNPAFLIDIAPLLVSNDVILLLTYMGEDIIHEDCQSEFAFVNTFDLVKSAWLQGQEAGLVYGKAGVHLGSVHDVGYGTSKAFTQGFESRGGQITFATLTHKDSRTESPASQINEALQEKADFIFGFYSGKEGISFAETWYETKGDKTPFIPSYMMQGDDIMEACGSKMIGQKTIGCWDRDGESEANLELKTFFEKNLGKRPHPYGLLAYETAELLGKALLKADSSLPEVVKSALTKVSISGPRGEVSFDPETRLTTTTDYEFEIVEEGGKIIRKKLREVEVPEKYYEDLAWGIKNLIKTGWTNPYLIG